MNGPDVEFYGEGTYHADKYHGLSHTKEFADFARFDGIRTRKTVACDYSKVIYPTSQFQDKFHTNQPVVFTSIVVSVFIFTGMVFLVYDVAVQRRNTKVVRTAARTSEIVASIFPKDVQKRILAEAEARERQENMYKRQRKRPNSADLVDFFKFGKDERKGVLSDCQSAEGSIDKWSSRTRPIADFFPAATILFADIVGFTAWSSTREPTQVFILLESIFHEFDIIAKRRGVYKVETIGDCYVGVCGAPVPSKDHVVVMSRFARDCVNKVHSVLRQLEIELGPDTAELGMRFGLHSGAVTAGVLRGER
jgi:Adenylate and Guanylate cyclase catalytic domain